MNTTWWLQIIYAVLFAVHALVHLFPPAPLRRQMAEQNIPRMRLVSNVAELFGSAGLILPAVLLIIFVILTLTFHSPLEAAHVILAVPFALTGGVLLQWILGFNFSVAVWVGYIALFGTAIQTGVVMEVYLEEAVKRKREEKGAGGSFTRADLVAAVKGMK